MREACRKIHKIIEHIRFGNTQFAIMEAEDLEKSLLDQKALPKIIVDDEHFDAIASLIRLKYGDDKPFCYGMAMLLHASERYEEASRLFSLSCGEHPNGTQKSD